MPDRVIVLLPGETITIRAPHPSPPPPSPIQGLDGRIVLPVPYLSQWSPTARHAPGDCGPASLAMAIHYLTDQRPTVDEVAIAGEVPEGARWANLTQIARAARRYSLKPRHVRPLTKDMIAEQLATSRPVLALLKYDLLNTPDDPNQDNGFKGAHFVLIVGGSEDTAIFHDPDRLSGDQFGEFREKTWEVFMNACGSTSQTPGNAYNYHGMVFDGS